MTAPKYVLDYSYAHGVLTPSKFDNLGAYGGIAYAGCDNTAKNITQSEFTALVKAKIPVALVIENFAADALQGAPAGDRHGQNLRSAAKQLGYDVNNCVLFWGYDTDSHSGDWAAIDAAMTAFAKHIPVVGYYGDSDSIDYLHARHPHWIYWQSDSLSFSPKNPTRHAHLLQKYNDPRAKGAAVDVNDVLRTPLRFFGEVPTFEDYKMADGLSPTALAQIETVVQNVLDAGPKGPKGHRRPWARLIAFPGALRRNYAASRAAKKKAGK